MHLFSITGCRQHSQGQNKAEDTRRHQRPGYKHHNQLLWDCFFFFFFLLHFNYTIAEVSS